MILFDIFRNIFLAPLELIFESIFTIAYNITNSEGLAIIILSLVVSTLVLPLYKRAEKLEQEERDKEKELFYWSEHIKRNFRGDEKYMILDAYYRENHYSPLYRLKSTLSILLQVPFFMAAYDLLGIQAKDRFTGTAFLAFQDLGNPDGLITIGDVSINVLPLVMTLVNVIACYIYSRGIPFKTTIRSYLLALVFLVLLYNSPSALLLYWTMNNVYSLVKIIIIKSKKPEKKAKTKKENTEGTIFGSFFRQEPKTSLFILPMAFMAVLTGLLIPLAYLSASPEEFIDVINPQNPLRYLLSSFFVSVGFFIVWPGIFYYLANKKAKLVMSVAVVGIAFVSAVDYLFFGSNTGTINTSLVFEHDPTYSVTQQFLNIAIVIVIMAACVFLFRFKKVMNIAFIAIILTTVSISAINAKKVQDSYTSIIEHIDDFRETEKPKIVLSQTEENVMVIMLDRAVSGYLPFVFYEFPELEEQFDGFVYYPNCMSFGQNTLKTTSALFGGYEYTPERMDARADESLAEKHDESLKVLPKLFSDQGYTVTLMDLPFPGWSWAGDYSAFKDIDNCYTYHPTDFYNDDTEAHINTENRRNRNMFMYSLFKCSPLCIQGFIYDSGDYLSVNQDVVDKYDTLENYIVLENMADMTVVDDDCSGGLFLFDNETTHDVTNLSNYDPYTPVDDLEGEYYICNGSYKLLVWQGYQDSTYDCFVAAMRELGDYMDYLKEIGVYDNTRIIIVSDHGTQVAMFEELVFPQVNAEWYNCLLMVKDFDAEGFTTDNTFMTNADVPTIALEGIIDDPVNPYTGNPINSDLKSGDLYVSYYPIEDETLWNPDYNQGNQFTYADDCVWLKVINGNIFDPDNWVQTDCPE